MASRTVRLNRIAPRRIRAQAALWVTDLHGPSRNPDLEARVRRWIEQDPRHAAAFELATEAWQRSGNLPGLLPRHATALPPRAGTERAGTERAGTAHAGTSRAAAVCAALFIGFLVAAVYFARNGTLTTGAGEQKTIELSDGTQVTLNANSRVLVQYDTRVRKVSLAAGEAFFNVTKHQPRPFVVVIGDRKVVAVGTSFMVRREETTGSAFAVTLVEGRVAVEAVSGPDLLPNDLVNGVQLLNPGERLRFEAKASQKMDRPSLDKITAWRRGQLVFDDTTLGEAAMEFNRYGSREIVIDSNRAQRLRVGGVFRIGDPASFAHAMANAYHLNVVDRGSKIILTDQENESK